MNQEFPETRWSQLLELRDPAHPKYAEHLERLARQYWRPVYHYLRALRPSAALEAEDLTQQFFAMLLSRRDLEKLSPDRGSFRGFLKTALRHFLASAERAALARTPPDGAKIVALGDPLWDEGRPVPGPEEAFDREWARGVLMEAVARLRKELETAGRGRHFEMFREYCLVERSENVSYEQVGRKVGMAADDVRNRLREIRLRLREILRELLADYLAPGASVEEELRFILSR